MNLLKDLYFELRPRIKKCNQNVRLDRHPADLESSDSRFSILITLMSLLFFLFLNQLNLGVEGLSISLTQQTNCGPSPCNWPMGVTQFPTVVLHSGPLSFVNPFNSSQILTFPPNPIIVYGSDYVTTGGGSPSIGNSVWLSTDHAATFSIISGVGPTMKAAYPYNISSFGNLYSEGVGFITQNGTLLFVSINFLFDVWASETGTTWRRIFLGPSTPYSGSLFPIIDERSDTIYLLTCTNQNIYSDVWISTDIGQHFSKQNILPIMSVYSAKVCTSPPAFFSVPTIAAVAQLTNITNVLVIAGGGQKVFSSTNDVWMSSDQGASFLQVTTTATWSVRNTITSMVTPQGVIILGAGWASASYSDLYVSMDGGFTFGWCSLTASSFVPFWSRFFIDELGFLYVAGSGLFRRSSFSFFNLSAVGEACGVPLPRCGPGITCLPGVSTTQYSTFLGVPIITCPLIGICSPYDYSYVSPSTDSSSSSSSGSNIGTLNPGSPTNYTDGLSLYLTSLELSEIQEQQQLSSLDFSLKVTYYSYTRSLGTLYSQYSSRCIELNSTNPEVLLYISLPQCTAVTWYVSPWFFDINGDLLNSPTNVRFRPLHMLLAAAVTSLLPVVTTQDPPGVYEKTTLYRGDRISSILYGQNTQLSSGLVTTLRTFSGTSTRLANAMTFYREKFYMPRYKNPAIIIVMRSSLAVNITMYQNLQENERLLPAGSTFKVLDYLCDQPDKGSTVVFGYDASIETLDSDAEAAVSQQLKNDYSQFSGQSTLAPALLTESMLWNYPIRYLKLMSRTFDKHNSVNIHDQDRSALRNQDMLHLHLVSNNIKSDLSLSIEASEPSKNVLLSAPVGWTCPDQFYNASDGCDCNCTIWDPDCNYDNSAELFGCVTGASPWCLYSQTNSVETGTCQYGLAPQSWTCSPSYYNSTDGCDCNCGIIDPDCNSSYTFNEMSPVFGCAANQECVAGSCQTVFSFCSTNDSGHIVTTSVKTIFALLLVLICGGFWE